MATMHRIWGSYSFQVSDAMFEFIEGWFERPDADELVGAEVIRGPG